MSDSIPFETTLTLQSYVQMRDAAGLDFLDAFMPSTNLERELGWDMGIRNLKGVVFQYKRPKLSKNGDRRFSVRYSNQEPPRQLDQMKNWNLGYGSDLAYYALPLVTEHDDLDKTLMRTVFVYACAIPKRASVIHIPETYCKDGRRQSTEALSVYCSDPSDTSNNLIGSIDASDVYGWEDLYDELTQCNAGFKIRYQGKSYQDRYHDDHRYYPHRDEAYRADYTHDERFGLTRENARYVTRFGSDEDGTFG